MTIISLSGAQGTGKSSCLETLKSLGYKTIDQKTSRSILKEYERTLDQVNKNLYLTHEFQVEILRRHYDTIKDKIDSREVYIQERSFADIFGYGCNILGPFNEYNKFMEKYYIDCVKAQQAYKHIFYLTKRPSNTIVDDGVRSTGLHFGTMMDSVIKTFIEEFKTTDVTYIDVIDHDERIARIQETLYAIGVIA